MASRAFRIWDKQHGRFYEPTYRAYAGELEDLVLSTCGDLLMRTMDGHIHESMFPDRFVVMQSTGLKDRNGVEIFEGDVLHFHANYVPREMLSGWINGVVCMDNPYHLELDVNGTRYSADDHTEEFPYTAEVVGNVHQNPDLLPAAA